MRLDVLGRERRAWLGRSLEPSVPLLVVLHGSGLDGRTMATWTGLAERGRAAGFTTVFPDAVGQMWDDAGSGRRDGLDDAAFIGALIEQLTRDGLVRANAIVLAGLSNGAFFAERLARHELVPAAMIVLVAGSARAASRQAQPRPAGKAAVLLVAGTADRLAPYEGGRARGPMGMLARRRARRTLLAASGRESVAVEVVAADWVLANGLPGTAAVERLAGELTVDRLSWSKPDLPPVTVYRVNGGGHGWPGRPQYVPRFLIGPVPREPDATGLLLDFARPLLTGG